jgi:hypothetical protein
MSDPDTGAAVPLSTGDTGCGFARRAPEQRELRLRVQTGDGPAQILTALWPVPAALLGG